MTAYYNEIDPYAAQWLRNLIDAGHIAPGVVDERDIRDVKPAELEQYTQCHFFGGIGIWSLALRRAGWPDDKPVWTGSCPCQPFSAAGRGDGFIDERHLWPHWYHLITQCEPGHVFGEQVASKDGLGWLDLVQADLEGAGYAHGAVDLCAAGVGAPHIRQRLWFIAERLGDAVRSRLEGYSGHGDRSSEPGRQQTHQDRPTTETSSNGGVADTDRYEQRQGRAPRRENEAGYESGIEPSGRGSVSGLGDTSIESCKRGTRSLPGAETKVDSQGPQDGRVDNGFEYAGTGVGGGQPSPTNGFWRDADWLYCRDGKWRPVEPIHVKMVDGTTPDVGYLCSRNEKDAEKVNAVLSGLRESVKAKEVQQRCPGMPEYVEAEEILQSEMHGTGADKRTVQQFESQPDESKQISRPELRVLRENKEAACSSQRPRSAEQCTVQFDDIVCLLPQSLSLSELYGNRKTAEALQILRETIHQAGALCDPLIAVQEVWASLSEEKKNRLRMDFDASRWEVLVPFPLIKKASNRAGRLKAYGNSINVEAAQAFIESYLSDQHLRSPTT